MKGMISEIDLSWLAGLLEGEGSFMMGRNTVKGKIYLYPKITVTMTDRDVIQRAADLLETSLYAIPNKRDDRLNQYRAQVNGTRAALIMSQLIPHLGNRRKSKINEILEQYGAIESTEIRRSRSCRISATERWAKYGTRSGKL